MPNPAQQPRRTTTTSRTRGAFTTLLAIIAVFLASTPALAQPATGLDEQSARALQQRLERDRQAQDAQQRAFDAIGRGQFDAARDALLEQINLDAGNFVPWYNLACVLAQQNELDDAAQRLIGAVERGFADKWQLERDPNLANLHEHETYRLIVGNWDQILDAAAQARFENLKEEYGPRYTYERDTDLRINLASGFEAESTRRASREIRLLTDWAIDTIFTDLRDPPMSETDPWVSVILPTERDFLAWAIIEYGPAAALGDTNRIGGSYSHDRKQLVAMDLGGTFRHEFLHVLHHRSTTRHGQAHPVWIQEGLCSLVEDYDIVADTLTPTASWRTNSVKRLERAGGLRSIAELAEMPRGRFTGSRPLANYAYARAVFLFLYDKAKLTEWYDHYTSTWTPRTASGVHSLEVVMQMDIEHVDEEFRRWLRALPEVPESVSAGGAALGVEIDPGRGEGPILTRVGRAARDAGLRPGDVITAIDARPTRDFHELCRVLGSYTPGRTVTIAYRRGREHGEANMTLTSR
ncbi:MAG: PDZ domain-containing protein [Phycisphaerales bacterium]